MILSLPLCLLLVYGVSGQSCVPPHSSTLVWDACGENNTALLASYLSVNGTSLGSVASLLNVARVISGALGYSGDALPILQDVTVVDALTVDGFVSTNMSVPPYSVDLAQLTAAANFPLDPTTQLPLLTQPYLGQYNADFTEIITQLTTISNTLATISYQLNLGLTTQVPQEVNNDGTYAGRMFKTVQLSDLVYTALFQPNVVVSDHDAGINIVNSQPLVSAFITPYIDPPNLGSAGSTLCDTNFAGATLAPGWPFGVSYGGNDHVVGGTVGTSATNGVTGLSYESVSTCQYGTTFGTPLPFSTKTSYGLSYGDNDFTALVGVIWPYCYSSTSCGSFMSAISENIIKPIKTGLSF